MNNDEQDFDDLPTELIDELKSADRPLSMITSGVDREISTRAKSQFSGRRRKRQTMWYAAAASFLLAVFVVQFRGADLDVGTDTLADLDRSGQVDIADVLYLARRSNDQSEIDRFAMKIVAIATDEEST